MLVDEVSLFHQSEDQALVGVLRLKTPELCFEERLSGKRKEGDYEQIICFELF